MNHKLRVARERFKFSCAHMTVFRDGTKERIHGHNFTIAVECETRDAAFERMLDFAALKNAIEALCEEWKEHLLLAQHNPHFEVVRDDGQELEFRLCGKRYVLPRAEVLILPVDNISVEALAELAARRLALGLHPALERAGVVSLAVTVEETPGQGGRCELAIGRDKL
jgi:6-pyruvoyltetrahydropterin/6-carboxytetrahydropterin synthase